MSDTQIRLPRTGDADVTFTGRQIAEADPAGDPNRWHELRLYAVEGDGYALAIQYRTRWQGELGRDDVYLISAERGDEVARTLREHDPVAAVAGFPPGEQFAEKQARLLADLRQRYDVQVSELLREADITTPAAVAMTDRITELHLRRYRNLLARGLAAIDLTRNEACLICDALNGTAIFEQEYMFIGAEVQDSIRLNHTDEKWSVDGPAIVRKLTAASPVTLCAIADAAERFWEHPERDTDQLLREVGLLRET